MKKYKFLIGLISILMGVFCFNDSVLAATGTAHIHYYNELTDKGWAYRDKTYINAKGHIEDMGYKVKGYNAVGVEDAAFHILDAKIFVVHNHGDPGIQYMGTDKNKFIAGIGSETPFGASSYPTKNGIIINNLGSGALNNMKIAIFYGCNTGVVLPIRGDLSALVVKKGATAAVSWKVTTYVDPVNEWNRLFFEKAKADTIVEGYRHADYWLNSIYGSTHRDIMANNRNEAGNIYARIY